MPRPSRRPAPSVPSGRRWFRTSIIWKLTLFVGVVIAINTGLLIGAAFYTTRAMLQDQIHDRLTTVAGDRQEMLVHGLKQQEDRAAWFANRTRIRTLLVERARGMMSAQRIREGGRVVPRERPDERDGPHGHVDRGRRRPDHRFERARGPGRRALAGGATPARSEGRGVPGRASEEGRRRLIPGCSGGSCGPRTTASWGP